MATIEDAIGYHFSNKNLISQALTHRSFSQNHNERLEFLGDSLVNSVIAEFLYRKFPDLTEGELSRIRSKLVKMDGLLQVANSIGLGSYITLGTCEIKSGGYFRPSILADAMEAVFGAVFIDGGFESVKQVVMNVYKDTLTNATPSLAIKDAKTALQERLQRDHLPRPDYLLVGSSSQGPFEVQCNIPTMQVTTDGCGGTRRAAEQSAAEKALDLVGP